jgi:hypothetical protein
MVARDVARWEWFDVDRGVLGEFAGRPVLSVRRRAGGLRVYLELAPAGRVDVSSQPGAVVAVVTDRARALGLPTAQVGSALAPELVGLAARLGAPVTPMGGLLGITGSLTHPLLGQLYALGAEPLEELPRWASPILRATDVADAARVAFGPKATRRVVRALARSLQPPLSLHPLAVAVAGRDVLEPDVLAGLLELDAPHRGPQWWPTVDDLDTATAAVHALGPRRAAGLLGDGLRGQAPLEPFCVLGNVRRLRDRAEQITGTTVASVAAECVTLLGGPTPPAAPPPAPERRAAPATPPVAHPLPPPPARPLPPAPPRVGRPARPVRPPELDGCLAGPYRLRVARHAGQLTAWAGALRNCLASYATNLASGTSWIIGVEADDTLIGCLEIDPATRRIRQFVGPYNRRLPANVTEPVIRALVATGAATYPSA